MVQMVKVKMVGSKMIHHPVAGARTLWPLDQFTLRRIADKDIEIQLVDENAKEGDEPKRAAPKEQADK
ncbi:hypothetical protein LRP30_13585 [Bradyrhizobium sp. C-145]|uniref:hypothetical protein n=1 Tax=Bradyrhizobium sp. C-145 TaxID=574727 RepID=UPI00201B6927|nr:hypothetical protein [Bradyrhizobium sp. C-145]UQR66214.1 hypothetical protein LRP30_13585 [Bradyrhizobium sp. C-145]